MPERESRLPHAWQTVQPIWAGPETTWEPPGGGEGAENQSLGWQLLGMLANIQGFMVFVPSKYRCFPLKAKQRRRWAVPRRLGGQLRMRTCPGGIAMWGGVKFRDPTPAQSWIQMTWGI